MCKCAQIINLTANAKIKVFHNQVLRRKGVYFERKILGWAGADLPSKYGLNIAISGVIIVLRARPTVPAVQGSASPADTSLSPPPPAQQSSGSAHLLVTHISR